MRLGLILAGGEGRRMGGMKPFVTHRGRPLIAHGIRRLGPQVDLLALNVGLPGTVLAERLSGLGLPVVEDDPDLAGRGPLSGVQAGLRAALSVGAEALVTLPCDMPDIPGDLVARLAAATAEGAPMAYFTGERAHPLCALWSPRLLGPLSEALMAAPEGLRVMPFLQAAGGVAIPVGDEAGFANINRPEDAVRAV